MDFRSRGNIFRRPGDRNSEDESTLVRAKPLPQKAAKKLGALGIETRGKDFVTASATSQADFYGKNTVLSSQAEKNKISAKILKAELMGNTTLAEKLKKKLEEDGEGSGEGRETEVLLMRTDKRTGLSMPLRTTASSLSTKCLKDDCKNSSATRLRDLVEEERNTTSEDAIGMFGDLASKMKANEKLSDDWVIDDVFQNRKHKAKHEEREVEKKKRKSVKDHKRQEQTMDSCRLCLDSSKFRKHLIVAIGFKTYLAVPSQQSLVDGHCVIAPISHASSTVQLDEDVHEEMKIWRKGLVAMFQDKEEDCVFMEMARNVSHLPHMTIECIPVPKEIGDSAPIYFKKAILECEEEWADNKKLVDLSVKDVRKSIPKGFSYFAVDFGLQSGYAHVIEDEKVFLSYFGKEIVGGMLDLDHNMWRKPKKESFEEQEEKVASLKELWAPYDWTERAKSAVTT